MAAKARGLAQRTTVWARREETRNKCATQPWCDAVYSTAAEAVREADIVILCTPVEHIVPLLQEIAPHLKPGALVTDVGSTKAGICTTAQSVSLPNEAAFIGAHPMAGSEKTGLENGSADLFAGRTCFVIEPAPDAPLYYADRFTTACAFWEALGMRLITTHAEEHDRLVAEVSHLPHLLAATLSAWLAQDGGFAARRLAAGPGLRDTTRIAAGDPALWLSIVRENRKEIIRALDAFSTMTQALSSELKDGSKDADAAVLRLLQKGKDAREQLDNT